MCASCPFKLPLKPRGGEESNGPVSLHAVSQAICWSDTFRCMLHSTLSSSLALCHHAAHVQCARQPHAPHAPSATLPHYPPPDSRCVCVCLCRFKEENSRGCQISEGSSFIPQAFSIGPCPFISDPLKQPAAHMQRCDTQCIHVMPSPSGVVESSADAGT